MGVINHNAVLATTCDEERLDRVRLWISMLPPEDKKLFLISDQVANGDFTVVMVPDGSKEGWSRSDDCDALRKKFIVQLDEYWKWVEVGYGEFGQKVLQGNNKNCYTDEDYCS